MTHCLTNQQSNKELEISTYARHIQVEVQSRLRSCQAVAISPIISERHSNEGDD
jgi:hypothetical protein